MDDADKPGPTKPPTPSTCDVCQGLFDMKSPRGYILERDSYDSEGGNEKPLLYKYVHRRDKAALGTSADVGCSCCRFLYHALRRRRSFHYVSDRPDSQSQLNDDLTATKLADLGSRKCLGNINDWGIRVRRRIVIQFCVGENYGQSRKADCLAGTVKFLRGQPQGSIYCFHTPCAYSFP